MQSKNAWKWTGLTAMVNEKKGANHKVNQRQQSEESFVAIHVFLPKQNESEHKRKIIELIFIFK